ncbi:MAG: hypothetical protein SF123_22800 [Chloroflexota bacterium]|nr:hypothetical protein [Chloroflexota bacterium]
MQQTVSTPVLPSRILEIPLTRELRIDLAIALVMALVWWGAALLLEPTGLVNVLTDQRYIFMPAGRQVSNPYAIGGYFNPPWAAVLLAPFSLLPLEISTLLQLMLYFVLITLLIHKYQGGRVAVIIAFTSFVAFNSALELNVEWMVCLGLLLPVRWSIPLLLIKPQTALGYYIGGKPREVLSAGVFSVVFLLFSFVLWHNWLPEMIVRLQSGTLAVGHNAAPMAVIGASLAIATGLPAATVGAPFSIAIGLYLAWRALKRKDTALAILAWAFFMPYLALYGLLLHLALLAARAPRAALIISLAIWAIFGSLLGNHLLTNLTR